MRDGWHQTTLGEVADINPEKTPKWEPDHQIRYVDIASVAWGKELTGDLPRLAFGEAPGRARRLIRSGDVVVSTVRPNLRAMAVVPEELDGEVASTGLSVLRAKAGIALPGFVWAVVSHGAFTDDMVGKATGSNYPAVRAEDVASFRMWLPPLVEQRRIVDLIATLDNTIQAAQATLEAVDEIVAAGRELIWQAGRFRTLADLCSVDGSLIDPTGANATLPHVGAERILGGIGEIVGVQSAAEDGVTSGKYAFDERHVIYSKIRPNLRKVAVPDFSGLCSADAYPLLPAPGVPRRYLQQLLLSRSFTEEAVGRSGRTKMPKINRSELMTIQVPDHDPDTMAEVADRFEALAQTRSSSAVTQEALVQLRSNLLAVLLSGEHEIPASYDDLLEDVVAA